MRIDSLAAAFAVALCIAGASLSANATNIVVPGSLENVEGNTNNGFPFNLGPFAVSSMRYQQVFDAAEFGAGPITITGIAFRPDAISGAAFGPTMLPNITIALSTTSQAVDGLSATFASNIGADVLTVFNGTLTLSSSFTGAGPKDFDISIDFQTPFAYDPNLGNLLLDVTNPNSTTTTQFDAHNADDAISRVYASSSGAVSGSTVNPTVGLVTLFKTQAIPEPGTLALFGLGLAGLGFARRRQAA